jgi:hypothetical protein
MKNMPEDMLFGLSEKMQTVVEMPDDLVWEKLNLRLHKHRRRVLWLDIVGKGLIAVIFIAALALIEKEYSFTDQSSKNLAGTQQNVEAQSSQTKEHVAKSLNTFKDGDNSNTSTLLSRQRNEKNVPLPRKENDRASIHTTATSINAPVAFDLTVAKFPVSFQIGNLSYRTIITKSAHKTKGESKQLPNIFRGVSTYFQVSPIMNYVIVDPRSKDDVEVTRIESPGIFSAERSGLGLEAGLTKSIGKKWSISAGVSYYQQKMQFAYFSRIPGQFQIVTGDDGVTLVPDDTETRHSINHTMKNIGAELNAFYLLRGEKLQQKAGFGFTFHRGLLEKSGTFDNSVSTYLHYTLQYRFEYAANERLSVYVQPRYSRPLIVNEELAEPVRLKTTRAGISMGVVYRLQR